MGFNVGGIAAALNGFQQGEDEGLARKAKTADIEFQAAQRKQQQEQWARDDQLRTDNAAIAKTKTVTDTPTQGTAAPGGGKFGSDITGADPTAGDNQSLAPTPAADKSLTQDRTAATTEDERLRQMGDNYLKAGKTDEYLKLHKQADEIGLKRSADAFAQLQAESGSLSLEQLAQRTQQIYNNDPFAGQMDKYVMNPDGSVTIHASNKRTGQAADRTYKDKTEFLKGLQAYYSPAMYSQLLQKEAEERMKVHNVPAGGALVRNDGTVLHANNNGFIQDGFNADGSPRLVKAGAGGAGGMGKNGKTPQTVYDESGKIIDTSLKGTPEQIAAAHATKDAVLQQNPTMGAGQVAKIATDVVLHPEMVQPRFDAATGSFADTYVNGATQLPLGTRPDLQTAVTRLGGEDKARQVIAQSLLKLPPPVAQMVQQGVADPAQAQQISQTITAKFGQAAGQAYLNNVEAAKFASRQSGLAGLWQAGKQALAGKPSAAQPTAQPGTQPAAQPAPVQAAPAQSAPGDYTPPPDSPAGRAAAQRAQRAQAEQQAQATRKAALANSQQELSKQFQADAKTMSPVDLARKYDSVRAELPPADASSLNTIMRRI